MIILVVVVSVVTACVRMNARRKNNEQRRIRRAKANGSGYTELSASYKKIRRPRSMLEHIQMEEEEVETIDFGEWN